MLPDVATGINFDLGPLALDFVLADGGLAYLRKTMVQLRIEGGQLFVVPDAPQFAHPVDAIQFTSADETVIGPALVGRHPVANGNIEQKTTFMPPTLALVAARM